MEKKETVRLDENDDLITRFYMVQTNYSNRNSNLEWRKEIFNGNHWTGVGDKDTDEFRLVFNYVRRIILGNVATFSRSPRPVVPIPGDSSQRSNAAARENLLKAIWPDLMNAWYDVELNASKLTYGVIQVLWKPGPDQPEDVEIGIGEDKRTVKRYTENPFIFRCIPSKHFYPIYRTNNKPNDFLEVFRFDPNRSVKDLEEVYGVKLQATGQVTSDNWMVVNVQDTCNLLEYWTKDKYVLIAMTVEEQKSMDRRKRGELRSQVQYHVLVDKKNEWKTIPFWVVPNIKTDPDRNITDGGAISDLDDIAQLNMHYNQIASEQAEDIITNIHRPLIYKSDDHLQDPNSMVMAAGEIFPIGADEELDPLNWNGEPKIIEDHQSNLRKSIQDLAFLGEAGFGVMSAGASGVAARVALTPLQLLVELKLPHRQQALQSICAFVFKMFEQEVDDNTPFQGWVQDNLRRFSNVTVTKQSIDRMYFVEINYGNLLPRDEYSFEQGEVYKYKTQIQSLQDTLDNMGVEDPEAAVQRIKDELQDPVLNPQHVLLINQAKAQAQQNQSMAPQGGMVPNQTPRPRPQPQQQQMPQQQMPQQPGIPGQVPQANPMETAPPVPPGDEFNHAQTDQQVGEAPGMIAPFLKRK